MAWTDERIELLRKLWEQGMTASQIADELGDVSRNAVIGKAHRLGLQARPSPVRPHEAAAEPVVVAAAPEPVAEPVAMVEEPVAPEPEPVEVEEPVVAPVQAAPVAPPPPPQPMVRSIGPGGFVRSGPGEQQPPSTPAPPRRLVPAKPSAEIAGKTSLLELSDKICKWPLGHPGEPDFHFCGTPVNPGFPYCLEHCSVAYQAQLPRRDRRPPPPLPYGGPRVR
ncbi:GcrA family cell cycle regulator [Sphingomonas jatrophae]|uniref:GcrA cell cycle regulator n=1 Tax=Sphingomonas jatrophae TaxID=1166337 RepID=A0A1I6LB29_9SPHN|nr:GcrA family cell cycle regulator [Sphingomonas jatrophae]SFS00634.1 GcrA cell cycle regulator [Sphingomonas jatrophae]